MRARLLLAGLLCACGGSDPEASGSGGAPPGTGGAGGGDGGSTASTFTNVGGGGAQSPYPAPDAWEPNAGPGGPAATFDDAQLYQNCAFLDGGEGDIDHHNLLTMYDGYLLMPWSPETGGGGLSFFEIDDPCNPVHVGTGNSDKMRETHAIGFSQLGGRWAVVDSMETLGIATEGGIQFWDVSDPKAPAAVSTALLPGFFYPDAYARVTLSTFWQTPYVYVGGADNGVFVVDATDPKSPVLVTQYQIEPTMRVGQVQVVGNLLVVTTAEGSRTLLLDVSDPATPQPIPGGDFDVTDESGTPRDAYFTTTTNGYVWYANKESGGGVIVWDIHDPSSPKYAGGMLTGENGGYVFVKDQFAFVGQSDVASIFDVSDLSAIVEVATLDLVGDLDTITPIGNVAVLSVDDESEDDKGSAIAPWTKEVDATPPKVTWIWPADGATGLAKTSRFGVTFSEFVDIKSAWSGSVPRTDRVAVVSPDSDELVEVQGGDGRAFAGDEIDLRSDGAHHALEVERFAALVLALRDVRMERRDHRDVGDGRDRERSEVARDPTRARVARRRGIERERPELRRARGGIDHADLALRVRRSPARHGDSTVGQRRHAARIPAGVVEGIDRRRIDVEGDAGELAGALQRDEGVVGDDDDTEGPRAVGQRDVDRRAAVVEDLDHVGVLTGHDQAAGVRGDRARPLPRREAPADGAEDPEARIQFDNRGFANAAAFSAHGDWLYVAMRGNRTVERVDAFTGSLAGTILDLGYALEGIALSEDDRWLFVDAYLSRELRVYDLAGDLDAAPAAVLSIPSAEPLEPAVLLGKQLFNDALDPRLSKAGYMACAHCHLDGESDHRTWDFSHLGEGLRNTIALLGRGGGDGPIHWSANFDEIQDFENPIRSSFEGTGLMSDAAFAMGTCNEPLGDPKAGLSEDLDALAAYVESLVTHPVSPFRNADGTLGAAAIAGKVLFESAVLGCTTCHTGSRLTDSTFLSPAVPLLHDVGTLGPGSGKRLGGELLGIDTPTLHGLWDSAPYLHDGSAATLDDVLGPKNASDQHGTTSQLTAGERASLIAYLLSLDGRVD